MNVKSNLLQLGKNDDLGFKFIGMGIRGDIEFYLFNTKKEKYTKLTRGQLQTIQNAHPMKINILLEDNSSWILYKGEPVSPAHSQKINYLDLWLTSADYHTFKEKINPHEATVSTQTKATNSEEKPKQISESYSEIIQDCPSIKRLMDLINKSIDAFPAFKESTPKIRKTGNLTEWIKFTFGTNDRETYFVIMALSEKFPELS